MIQDQIASQLGLSKSYLERLATSASYRYKEYKSPKKSGGERVIHHPARELKLIQDWLVHNVLHKLPVHVLATAYRKGSSIKMNADMHTANNYLLRVDFQDFFHSLTSADISSLLSRNPQIFPAVPDDKDIDFIKRILSRHGALTIGAPTSPLLSNAIMFDFDKEWSERAQSAQITYTRYADDLYFSTNQGNVLQSVLQGVEEYIKQITSPKLMINGRKTAFSSRKWRRLATGLVLTSDRKISIGRKKKRILKAWVNNLKFNRLTPAEVGTLRGWIAYLQAVEPLFVVALQRKYELDFKSESTWKT